MTRARAFCSFCRREQVICQDGTLIAHKIRVAGGGLKHCFGSHRNPLIPMAPPSKETPVVPAEHFMATLAANVDNEKLTDAQFREFVRTSIVIVIYPRPEKS